MKKNKFTIAVAAIFLVAAIATIFIIFNKKEDSSGKIAAKADFEGLTAGVLTGTPQKTIIESVVSDVNIMEFNDFSDVYSALLSHKIDFFINSNVSYRFLSEQYSEFYAFEDISFRDFDVGTIFPKTEEGQALKKEFDEYIKKIKDDGKLQQITDKWLEPGDNENIDIPSSGSKGTLQFATCSSNKPFAYILNEKIAGFDIAIIAGFAREYGYGLEISDTNFSGMLTGISLGKFDLAASQIAWTAERAEQVLYSEFYYTQSLVPIVLKENVSSDIIDGAGGETKGFLEKLQNSFKKSFLDENRWRLVLNGTVTTLIITIFGFLLANILGIIFCFFALSKSRFLKILADIYSYLMQGTPIVVILMILFYIVFAKSNVNGILIAILGFGLAGGAYLAQIFTGAVKGVDRGQWEASLAMGFTKNQTFKGIILPQMIRTMLPGYFSQLISMMKGTAIVGYIAVQDLTKAGDMIRSSTFEAIFPLLMVALIYLLISSIMLTILKMIQKHLDYDYCREKRKKKMEEAK